MPTQLSHDGSARLWRSCRTTPDVPKASVRSSARRLHRDTHVENGAPCIHAGGHRGPAGQSAGAAGLGAPAEHGLEQVDQRAWDLSVESFQTIERDLEREPTELAGDPEFLRRLANALILSGLAMIWSGTSRPASGGEHEISHAIDELYGGRAMHGEQVAFGCTVSVALYGEDTGAFRGRLRSLGLPEHPRDLGLTGDDMVRLLLHAPETRPGRFTIVEDANLDEEGARALVSRIWGQP